MYFDVAVVVVVERSNIQLFVLLLRVWMVASSLEFHFFRFSKLVACVLNFIIEVATYAAAGVIYS